MKNIFIIYMLIFFAITGCGSSVRFTSEESKTPPQETDKVKGKGDDNFTDASSEKDKIIVSPDISEADILETGSGVASYYGKKFHGRKTASGEPYDMNDMTAAHATYPFNTIVRVTNMLNDKSVIVKINDRKPDFHGRIIDVSYAAAKELDFLIKGITEVKVDVISWGSP